MIMTLLVTGGAGFIGSHLVKKLVESGESVIVVDNLSTGKKEYVDSRAKLVVCDIRDKELEGVFRENEIELVAHLASQTDVSASIEDPVSDGDVNVLGTLNLLELCRKYDVKKIVFTSSAAVYGEPRYLPVDEKHELAPISPYGCSKLAVETYLAYYHRLYGIDFVVLRLANVYGPRQSKGVVKEFIERLLKGESPVIYGDGKQTRDFIYVDDVVNAIVLAMERKTRRKQMNIATCKGTSVLDLLQTLQRMLASRVEPIFMPARKEIRRCYFSYELAKNELGWEPTVELREGLRKTILWHCERAIDSILSEVAKARKLIKGLSAI